MGNISAYLYNSSSHQLDLCDDLIEWQDVKLHIHIRSGVSISQSNRKRILEYMQYTKPSFSYMKHNSIVLLYDQKTKPPFFRSNVSGDIISHISSELSIWIIKNTSIDLQMIDVNISTCDYLISLKETQEILSCETSKDMPCETLHVIDNTNSDK